MKIMRLLTICALVFALAVCSVPLVNAVVSPENKSPYTVDNIEQERIYANRLRVTLDTDASAVTIYKSDFPEIEDKIISIENTEPQNGVAYRIVFLTLNTTTRVELAECIELLEANEKVFKISTSSYMPQFSPEGIPSGLIDLLNPDVSSEDALAILHFSVAKGNPTIRESFFADVDGDEEITANDALLALQTSVNLIPETRDCFDRWVNYMWNVATPIDLLYPDEPDFMLLNN